MFQSKTEASSLRSKSGSAIRKVQELDNAVPLDVLTVKVLSLRLADNDSRPYAIKVTFFDQLILSGIIKPIGARDSVFETAALLVGTMNYDPSDYEKMCLFADFPLIVFIQPLRMSQCTSAEFQSSVIDRISTARTNTRSHQPTISEISCCNIDILKMFIDTDKMCVKVRMQPSVTPTALHSKSWDNLPLLTLKLAVERQEENKQHHDLLKNANYVKLTFIGAYNMRTPVDDESVYMVASRPPRYYADYSDTAIIKFHEGTAPPKNFNSTSFYPSWESLRACGETFCQSNDKFTCSFLDIQNDTDLNIEQYLVDCPDCNTVIWGSYHRTLMLGSAERVFSRQVRAFHWPIEIHSYGRTGELTYMASLPLLQLLYPGVTRFCIAVPLHWMNPKAMKELCDCHELIAPLGTATGQKGSKLTAGSTVGSSSVDTECVRSTGADDLSAFVLVEVKLAKPLVKLCLPVPISRSEINEMLDELEQEPEKRSCTGRGQLDREWQATVRGAVASLRKVPHHGLTEFCIFYRQLSETRTRVELSTSFWMDAAVYVNNNFVVQEYMESDEKFEELLVMSHACLMKIAVDTIVGPDDRFETGITLRAARQARQLQDVPHAADLYLQVAAEEPTDRNAWRELATCLKDVDRDWAEVCLDTSFELHHRHPLTLLAKACMVYEEDPDGAEPFFMAILGLYPSWATAWVIASVYFAQRDMFHMADMIIESLHKTKEEIKIKELGGLRAWERELGDWWESTPLLPGMSPYYDAADLLLRLRSVKLAEACLAMSLTDRCQTAAYFHLVALSCRLRGDVHNALCHLQAGIARYGEINFLRSLEAECHHMNQDVEAAKASFEKSGTCVNAYSVLLSLSSCEPARVCSVIVDLLRRQPSAHAWMALADHWMQRIAAGETESTGTTDEPTKLTVCAQACAEQALKLDRRAGRAWALLADLVDSDSRRAHCIQMAAACGHTWSAEDPRLPPQTTDTATSYYTATSRRKCKCHLCDHIAV